MKKHLMSGKHKFTEKVADYYIGIVKKIVRNCQYTCRKCGYSTNRWSRHVKEAHPEIDSRTPEYNTLSKASKNTTNSRPDSKIDRELLAAFVQRKRSDRCQGMSEKVIAQHAKNAGDVLVFLEKNNILFSDVFNPDQPEKNIKQIIRGNLKNVLFDFASTHTTIGFVTLRNKLNSFSTFTNDYLDEENFDPDIKTKFIQAVSTVRTWLFKQTSVKDEEDFDTAREERNITHEDKENIFASEHYKNISALATSDTVDKSYLARYRDMLTLTILLKNPLRPGACVNMTMRNFNKRRVVEDRTLVKVHRHKTEQEGPACLTFEPVNAVMLEKWVTSYRPLVTDSTNEEDCVFLTGEGKPFSSSSLHNQNRRFASKCGLGKNFTSTQNRKSSSTRMAEEHPELENDTAIYMGHKLTTAKRSYRFSQKDSKIVNVYNVLNKCSQSDLNSVASGSQIRSDPAPAKNKTVSFQENNEISDASSENITEICEKKKRPLKPKTSNKSKGPSKGSIKKKESTANAEIMKRKIDSIVEGEMSSRGKKKMKLTEKSNQKDMNRVSSDDDFAE